MMKTTILQKKNNTPEGITLLPSDISFELDTLITFFGRQAYIILYNDIYDISSVACTKIFDLPFYTAKYKILPEKIDESKFKLLNAFVLDPENLPYELKSGSKVFVIYNNWSFNEFDNIQSATEKIEHILIHRIIS